MPISKPLDASALQSLLQEVPCALNNLRRRLRIAKPTPRPFWTKTAGGVDQGANLGALKVIPF
jgi:hypothetical protein